MKRRSTEPALRACFTRPGTPGNLPRPSMTPVDVKLRLMRHIGAPAGVH